MSSLRRPKLQIKPKISVSSPSSSTSSSSPRKNRSISKNNNNSVSTCLSDGNVPALETVDNNSKTNCETNVSSNTAIIVNIDVSESNLETNVLVDHGKKQSGRKKANASDIDATASTSSSNLHSSCSNISSPKDSLISSLSNECPDENMSHGLGRTLRVRRVSESTRKSTRISISNNNSNQGVEEILDCPTPIFKAKMVVSKQTPRKMNKCKLPVDKNKMTMKDLLMYNPSKKMALGNGKDKIGQSDGQSVLGEDGAHETEMHENNVAISKLEDEDMPPDKSAPRVKVGPEGELILDEESVVINRKRKIGDLPAIVESSRSLSASTTYSSFRRPNKTSSTKPRWNEQETARFYNALKLIGTDFTLMEQVFFIGSRSRMDLRNKFKREEKINKFLIDNALCNSSMEFGEEIDAFLEQSGPDSDDD